MATRRSDPKELKRPLPREKLAEIRRLTDAEIDRAIAPRDEGRDPGDQHASRDGEDQR
jgi:hypothetical protein